MTSPTIDEQQEQEQQQPGSWQESYHVDLNQQQQQKREEEEGSNMEEDELRDDEEEDDEDGLTELGGGVGSKRYRTNYSRCQIGRLEQEFRREKYLSRLKRTELAKELGLKESTIKVWFQNRRMKEKRQLTTINIPQILANSDPFLYSYLLDSAKAYYNFTSQFCGSGGGGGPAALPSLAPGAASGALSAAASKLDLVPAEAAIAAFVSSTKLCSRPPPPPAPGGHNHNSDPIARLTQLTNMAAAGHVPHMLSPLHSSLRLEHPTSSHSLNRHGPTKSSAITFRPYIDS